MKASIILSLILLITANFNFTNAQYNIEWEHTFGFEKNDGAQSIIATLDGGFAMTGYCSDLEFNLDVWLVKIDTDGRKLWNKKYGTPNGIEKGVDLLQLENGNYLLLANCNSKGSGAMDLWLLLLDSEGNLLEEKTFGKEANDWASQLISCKDGGFGIVATTNSAERENSSMWLLKLSSGLAMEWEGFYAGDENRAEFYKISGAESASFDSRDEAFTLVQTSDGGFAIGGFLSDPKNITNCWVVKTDNLGIEQWNKSYGTFGGDYINGIYESNKKIVAVGVRYDKKDNYNYMMNFAIVGKDIVKQKNFNADDFETIEASCQTKDGGFLLVGFKGENLGKAMRDNTEPKLDTWMVKVSEAGNKEWEYTIDQNTEHRVEKVIETDEGAFLMAGSKRKNSSKMKEFWVVKVEIEN